MANLRNVMSNESLKDDGKSHPWFYQALRDYQTSNEFHLSSIGSVTGFLVAFVGAYSAVILNNPTRLESWIATAAIISLFLQSISWLNLVKRNNRIRLNYLRALAASSDNFMKASHYAERRNNLYLGNRWREFILLGLTYLSIGLSLLMIGIRIW